ncbi:hypothetical protein PS833_02910 [Pseudomonas fluorescens]|uniref:Uncharacterized protein n=1 Tax=Pseudomonas fluorescens TaxID=294 RepID=A0A5E7CWU7_PSEFL|nr:hypothetical protein PS833_02910 [Pseudomonas fluorescens]
MLLTQLTGDQFWIVLQVAYAYRQLNAFTNHVDGQIKLRVMPRQANQQRGNVSPSERGRKINSQAPPGLGKPCRQTIFSVP